MAFKQGGRSAGTVPGPHGLVEPLAAEADLASRWVGGSVLAASDESFGELRSSIAIAFDPDALRMRMLEDGYLYPGPIQYFGPTEVCDRPTETILLERS